MQSAKTLTMVVAALALAGGAWYLNSSDRSGWTSEPTTGSGELVLPELAAQESQLAAIEVIDAQSKRRVELRGGEWTLPDKGGYAAKQDTVLSLFRSLLDLQRLEPKTANPARHEKVGLVDPDQGGSARKVRFLDGSGAELDAILLGESYRGLANPALFVRAPGEDQCWLASGQVNVRTSDYDWLERDLFALGSQRIASAELTQPTGGYRVSRAAPEDSEFSIGTLPPGMQVSSSYMLSAPARMADNFRFQDVGRAADVDLSGVTAEASATLTAFDGLVIEVRGQRVGEGGAAPVWAKLSARIDPEGFARGIATGATENDLAELRADLESEVLDLNRTFSDWLFQLEATQATGLFRPLDELLELDEAAALPEDVSGPPVPGLSEAPNTAEAETSEPPAEGDGR